MEGQLRIIKAFKRRLALLLVVGLLISLTACNALPFEIDLPWLEPATVATQPQIDLQPEPQETPVPTPQPSPTISEPPTDLILWLPPELDPRSGEPAANILKSRLEAFAAEHDIQIILRTKTQTGAGSLLDSLSASKGAADEVLPDLLMMGKQDLNTAAGQDLIYTNDELAGLADQTDWYNFARTTGMVFGVPYGVGIMGDPLVMVYHSESQLVPSNEWERISANFGYFGFAADQSQGRFLLLLYLNAGGSVIDPQLRVILQEEPLTQALQLLKDTVNSRHMSDLAVSMQTDSQVWDAYSHWQLDTAVLPLSLVLNGVKEAETDIPEPSLTQPPVTITNGWAWALGSPNPLRQELAMQLMEYLVETEFLAEWTEALGRLPGRPSSLAAWTDSSLKPAAQGIAQATILAPGPEVMNQLGPILRNATMLIVRDDASPSETAKQAVESVN